MYKIKVENPATGRRTATIAKVKKLKKPYARKIQILTVAEQRAKVMKKTAIANLFKSAKADLRRKHNAVSDK